jgi:hypothetical protein
MQLTVERLSMDDTAYLVFRRWPRWVYCLRRFDILVDGKKVGNIANGAENTIPVSHGQHTVELRVSWIIKSQLQIVELKAGEKALLECGTSLTILSLLPLILAVNLQFLVNLKHLAYAGIILLFLLNLGIVGYCVWLFRGRGKFICLKEPQLFG